jgi:hypothetical protein
LKTLNPYYKDILIHDTPEIRKKLEDIPKVLLSHATVITGKTEIFIDRIIGKESGEGEQNEERHEDVASVQKHVDQEFLFNEAIISTSTSLVTRACRPNTGLPTTSSTILDGKHCLAKHYFPTENCYTRSHSKNMRNNITSFCYNRFDNFYAWIS